MKKIIFGLMLFFGFFSIGNASEVAIKQLPIYCGNANSYECFVGQYDNGINSGVPYIYGTQNVSLRSVDPISGDAVSSITMQSTGSPAYWDSKFSRINLLNGDYLIIGGGNKSSNYSYYPSFGVIYVNADTGTFNLIYSTYINNGRNGQNTPYPVDITTDNDYIYIKGVGKYIKIANDNYVVTEIADVNADPKANFLTNSNNWVRALHYSYGNLTSGQVFQYFGNFFLTYTTHSGDIYKWQYIDLGGGTEVFNGELFYESELVENSLSLSFNDLFWTNFDASIPEWTFLYSVASVNDTTEQIYSSTHSITYNNDGVFSDLVGTYYILNRDGRTFNEPFYFSNGLVNYDTNVYYLYNVLNDRGYYWKDSGLVTLYTDTNQGAGIGGIVDPGGITYPGSQAGSGGTGGTGGTGTGSTTGTGGINYDTSIFNFDQDGDGEIGILNGEIFIGIGNVIKYFFEKIMEFFGNIKALIEKLSEAFTSEEKTLSFNFIQTANATENISTYINGNVDETQYKETVLGKIDLLIKGFIAFFILVIGLAFFIGINRNKNG